MSKQHFFFRQDGQLKKINLDKVVFLEAAKNYTWFKTLDGDHLVRISLNTAMELLPADKFLRVHRSFAVSFDHISEVGRESVLFTAFPKLEVPVSRPYYVQFTKQVVILDSGVTDKSGVPGKKTPHRNPIRPVNPKLSK
jgi:DNA-binding LytR/AlgR family response regulator